MKSTSFFAVAVLLLLSLVCKANDDIPVSIIVGSFSSATVGTPIQVSLTGVPGSKPESQKECELKDEAWYWSVLSVEHRTDDGTSWNSSTYMPSISPSNANPTTLETNFPTEGKWRVRVKLNLYYLSSCGGSVTGSSERDIDFTITPSPSNTVFSPKLPSSTNSSIKRESAPTNREDPTNSMPIQIGAGEEVLFTIRWTDTDFKKEAGQTTWTDFPGAGPYEVIWSVSGNAEFQSPEGNGPTVTTQGAESKNLKLVFKNTAFATGESSITVKAILKDKAPFSSPDPHSGSLKDPDASHIWSFVKRTGTAPTGIHQLPASDADAQGWRALGKLYTYQLLPDTPNLSQYKNQSVLETFGLITARGFTTADLDTTSQWYTDNNVDPNDINEVVRSIFSSGTNASFVINSQDQMEDGHDGFQIKGVLLSDIFKGSALTDTDGVGYDLPQTYSSAQVTIGNYVITRAAGNSITNPIYRYKKVGP